MVAKNINRLAIAFISVLNLICIIHQCSLINRYNLSSVIFANNSCGMFEYRDFSEEFLFHYLLIQEMN